MKRSAYFLGCCGIFGIIILVGGIITMISLLALYINYSVEQDEYAVGYDTYNMKWTKIYNQGRYPIKVGENMIKIKRTLQEFSKDISCLTKDKILLDINIALQYQYEKDKLIPVILEQFSSIDNYKQFLFDRITSSIMNSCLSYDAEQYYTDRSAVDAHMYSQLIHDINYNNIGANVEFLQLVNIQFPVQISTAITQKQNIDQEALTVMNDRSTLLTNANTELLETIRTSNILLINANNTANIILNQAETNAEIQNMLWTKRAYGYEHASGKLGLNSSQIIDYIESDIIQKSDKFYTNLNIN